MSAIPIYNPRTPYLGLLREGFNVGQMLRIKGQMKYTSYGNSRVTINLQVGPALEPRDNVTLHLSIRPTEQCIVRNHMVSQQYGSEERYGACPIQPGQHFDILILAEPTNFKIAINQQHFCTFTYRLPVNQTRYISINEDATINSIAMEHDTHTPYIPPALPYPSAPSYPYLGLTQPVPPPPPYTPVVYPESNYPHGHNPGVIHGHPSPYGIQPPIGSPYPPHGAYVAPTAYSTTALQDLEKRKKRNKAIKYAAGIGGVGLGALALSSMLSGGGSDDGDCE